MEDLLLVEKYLLLITDESSGKIISNNLTRQSLIVASIIDLIDLGYLSLKTNVSFNGILETNKTNEIKDGFLNYLISEIQKTEQEKRLDIIIPKLMRNFNKIRKLLSGKLVTKGYLESRKRIIFKDTYPLARIEIQNQLKNQMIEIMQNEKLESLDLLRILVFLRVSGVLFTIFPEIKRERVARRTIRKILHSSELDKNTKIFVNYVKHYNQ